MTRIKPPRRIALDRVDLASAYGTSEGPKFCLECDAKVQRYAIAYVARGVSHYRASYALPCGHYSWGSAAGEVLEPDAVAALMLTLC